MLLQLLSAGTTSTGTSTSGPSSATKSISCVFLLNNKETHGITYAGQIRSQGTFILILIKGQGESN